MVQINGEHPEERRADQFLEDRVQLRIVGLLELLDVALGIVRYRPSGNGCRARRRPDADLRAQERR